MSDELEVAIQERHTFEQDGRWSSDRRWTWFWAALLVVCLPLTIPYLIGMWSFQHYQYFPFVFLVVGYLVWTRSDRVLRAPAGWWGWTTVIVGIALLCFSAFLVAEWFAGLAFVLLAGTCVASMRGTEDRSMLHAALPLIMLVQWPIGLDNWLVNQLQRVTTNLSSVALDLLGVPHAIDGNIVQLVSGELFVAEACSGVQSVFTLAFIACVIVALNRRRLWLTPLYLVIAVLLALAGNTLRVTAVALAQHWFGQDLSKGFSHDLLGYATLGIATAFLLSFDQLIITLLHPAHVGGSDAMSSPLVRVWNFLVSDLRFSNDDTVYGARVIEESDPKAVRKQGLLDQLVMSRMGWYVGVGLLAVIGLGATISATRVEINEAPKQIVGSYILFNPSQQLMQGDYRITTVGGHRATRDGNEPRLGQNADLWDCNIGDLPAQIVVSQTYRGWHELCVCYENDGWTQLSRDVTDPPESEQAIEPSAPFITARFKNDQGRFGYLLYSAVNKDGSVTEWPDSWGAFGSRLFGRLERHGLIAQQDLVMFQMWLEANEKISPEMLRQMQLDFLEMRSRLSKSIVQDAVNQTSTAGLTEQAGS